MLDGEYLVFDDGFIEAAGGWVAVEEGCGAWVFKGRGGDSAKAGVAGGGAALDGEGGAGNGEGGARNDEGGAGSGKGGRLGKRFPMIGERRASRVRSAGVVAVARGPSESRARGTNAEPEHKIQEMMTRFRRDPSRYRIGILREGGSAAAAGAARRLLATAGMKTEIPIGGLER
jgi:hypothetical protein